jgi:hypothetical protein
MYIAISILLTLVPGLQAKTVSTGSDIEALLNADSRWQKRISLEAHRCQLGDLLERLGSLAGIRISADSASGAGDVPLAVRFKDVPAGVALEAVWSVVSYKGAEYSLTRDDGDSSPDYVLTRTLNAQQLAARVLAERAALFRKLTGTLLNLSRLPPEERKKQAHSITEAALQPDEKYADALLQSEHTWLGMETLSQLPTGSLERALEGQSVTVRYGELTAKGQEFVKFLWVRDNKDAHLAQKKGLLDRLSPPDSITLTFDDDELRTTPSLFIEIERMGGYSYLGGSPFARGFRDLLAKRWMNEGDAERDPRDNSRVEVKENANLDRLPPDYTRLLELSRGTEICFAARLPTRMQQDPGSPFGQTVGQFRAQLNAFHPYYISKWRKGVLLVDYLPWFKNTNQAPPWAYASRLRSRLKQTGGHLTLDDLFEAAGRLTPIQLQFLGSECADLRKLSFLRDVFALAYKAPLRKAKLLALRGLPLDSDLSNMLIAIPNLPFAGPIQSGAAKALRITDAEIQKQGKRLRKVTIGYVVGEGRFQPVASFEYGGDSQQEGVGEHRGS